LGIHRIHCRKDQFKVLNGFAPVRNGHEVRILTMSAWQFLHRIGSQPRLEGNLLTLINAVLDKSGVTNRRPERGRPTSKS
jgi:hypothetical protein